MGEPTISSVYLLGLARYAEARGVAVDALLRSWKIGRDAPPERWVALTHVYELFALSARTLDDPAVPLGYASQLRVEDHHVLGFAVMSAKSGIDALRVLTRFANLMSDSAHWSLEERANSVRLCWSRPGPRTLGARLANEAALAEVVVGMRQILRGTDVQRVELRHGGPSRSAEHTRFFGSAVHWDAAHDALELAAAPLRVPPASENPALHDYFVCEAERRKGLLTSVQSLAAEVSRAIEADFAEGPPTLDTVSRRLASSPRRLREGLALEGTSFRRLTEAARRTRAEELLARPELSITDIALRLGFSETSAFTRAFMRWHGVAPSRARGGR